MKFNLKDSEYESKNFRPFNKGMAGITNVMISEIRKEKNFWFIIFQDENDSELRDYQSYLKEEHPKFKQMLRAQGIVLRHYWEVIVGNTEIPVFETTKEMLDEMMNAFIENIEGKKFRIAVDYGNGNNHSRYLIRKRYVPFIENFSEEPTGLKLDSNAHTEPLKNESTEDPEKKDDDTKEGSNSEKGWFEE